MTKGNGLPCVKCGTSGWYKDGACIRCQKVRNTQSRKEFPERKKEQNQKWYHANKEKHQESGNRWLNANRDRHNQHSKKWRDANKGIMLELHRRWRSANPERDRASIHARRAKKTKAGGSYTDREWVSLCNHYGNKCLRCGRDDIALTVDHVKPLDKGGTNDISNLQPLCQPCNSAKGTKHIDYRPDAGPLRWIQAKLFG